MIQFESPLHPARRRCLLFTRSCWLPIVFAAVFASIPTKADTVSLKPSADTCIFSLNPTFNFGGADSLILGGIAQGGQAGRMLIQFDVTNAMPPGSQLIKASLKIRVTKKNSSGPAESIRVHRLNREWLEGTKTGLKGTAAAAGEATWRTTGVANWTKNGAAVTNDYVFPASATNSINNIATYTFESARLTEDVQAWISGATTNFGWILISATESTARTARRIASRESGADSPELVLEFTPGTPPPAPKLEIQKLADEIEFHFLTDTTANYALQFNDTVASQGWQTFTTVTGTPGTPNASVRTPIPTASARFYRILIEPAK